MTTMENNIAILKNVIASYNELEKKQLAMLNKLRALNKKQQVSSFEEHRTLKLQGK